MHELESAIRKLKQTATGEDNVHVHNAFFKHMTASMLEDVLRMFNTSWCSGMIPGEWKIGIMFPILKPGKDKHDPSSYRPISLLSCMGKLMERVVSSILVWLAEDRGWFSETQCGFRKSR